METSLTAEIVRDRITRAHLSVNAFLKRNGISSTTFWRWERNLTEPHPVTVQKIKDALERLDEAA